MQYGLNKKGFRKLAFKLAVANKKKYSSTWDENKMAGEEWMRSFFKEI